MPKYILRSKNLQAYSIEKAANVILYSIKSRHFGPLKVILKPFSLNSKLPVDIAKAQLTSTPYWQ